MALALVFRISFQHRTRPYMEFGFDLPRIEQGEIGFIFIRRNFNLLFFSFSGPRAHARVCKRSRGKQAFPTVAEQQNNQLGQTHCVQQEASGVKLWQ